MEMLNQGAAREDPCTIHLPCKIRDTLYRKDGMWECIGFDCTTGNVWRVKLRRDIANGCAATSGNYLYTKVSFGAFGKTIFTSREECEKAFPPKPADPRFSEAEAKLARQKREHQDWLLK